MFNLFPTTTLLCINMGIKRKKKQWYSEVTAQWVVLYYGHSQLNCFDLYFLNGLPALLSTVVVFGRYPPRLLVPLWHFNKISKASSSTQLGEILFQAVAAFVYLSSHQPHFSASCWGLSTFNLRVRSRSRFLLLERQPPASPRLLLFHLSCQRRLSMGTFGWFRPV